MQSQYTPENDLAEEAACLRASKFEITLIEPLSRHELELLHLIAEGLFNLAIAQKLFLTTGTVQVHMSGDAISPPKDIMFSISQRFYSVYALNTKGA